MEIARAIVDVIAALLAVFIYGFVSGWMVRGWIRRKVIVARSTPVSSPAPAHAAPTTAREHAAAVIPSKLPQVVVLDGKGTRH